MCASKLIVVSKAASETSSVAEPPKPILRQRLKWGGGATRDPNRLVLDCGQMAAAQARTLSRPCFTAACSASAGAACIIDVQLGEIEGEFWPTISPKTQTYGVIAAVHLIDIAHTLAAILSI